MGLVYDALARALSSRRPLRHRLKRGGHSVLVSSGSLKETPDHRARRIKELGSLKNAYGAELYGKVKDLGFPFAEALELRLDEIDGAWWCVFDPCTQVDLPPDPQEHGQTDRPFQWKPNPAADWIRERWARRYNKSWSAIIDAWSSILSGHVRAFWIEPSQGIDANFEVGAVTGWSVPSHDHPYFHRRSR